MEPRTAYMFVNGDLDHDLRYERSVGTVYAGKEKGVRGATFGAFLFLLKSGIKRG